MERAAKELVSAGLVHTGRRLIVPAKLAHGQDLAVEMENFRGQDRARRRGRRDRRAWREGLYSDLVFAVALGRLVEPSGSAQRRSARPPSPPHAPQPDAEGVFGVETALRGPGAGRLPPGGDDDGAGFGGGRRGSPIGSGGEAAPAGGEPLLADHDHEQRATHYAVPLDVGLQTADPATTPSRCAEGAGAGRAAAYTLMAASGGADCGRPTATSSMTSTASTAAHSRGSTLGIDQTGVGRHWWSWRWRSSARARRTSCR